VAKVLEFVAAEKQCCPFFTFELAFEPDDGPLWLRLRGSAEIKAFVRSELDGIVPAASLASAEPTREARNKAVVRRLIDEVMNAGRLDVIPELYAPGLAPKAERWIAPFRASFPDMHMEIVELIATGDTVVGRFKCTGTHLGEWLGHPPTGRRFTTIDEAAIFHIQDGKIVKAWSIEDTLRRLDQLGLR
jgi:predicted ester cyclase